jgi:murein DD-endopeptidase MepM/ murein hydrolase activator NlpD
VEQRHPRGRYRGRRRVPKAPRNRYAAVMTTALVGAGVVALGAGAAMPDLRQPAEPAGLALVDASAEGDLANRVAGERASRSDARGVGATAQQSAPNVYVLPLRSYTITSKFGPRWGRNHPGIDLGAPEGTPYYSIARGKVILARWNGGYGYCIMIDHGGGVVSVYGHSSKILVREGQTVEAGDVIGRVGNTGYSFGSHLHLEIRLNDKQVDPIPYLKSKGADVPAKSDVLTG